MSSSHPSRWLKAAATLFQVGSPPVTENLPTRNRLVSSLCLGVVIAEAAEKSGSLINARIALEQDRQVFAAPGGLPDGSYWRQQSSIKLEEGARLVDCIGDVLQELAPQRGEAAKGCVLGETKPTSGGEVVANAGKLEPNDINDI